MVNFVAVYGCGHRSNRGKTSVSFFYLPGIKKHAGNQDFYRTTAKHLTIIQLDRCLNSSLLAFNIHFLQTYLTIKSFRLTGLIADRVGSYVPAFLMAGGIIVVAAAIPFVLLCACLKRSNVPLQDEKAENEVVELQGKPAVPYAGNAVRFIADEEAGQAIDDAVDVVKANQAAISIAGAGRSILNKVTAYFSNA